MSELEHRKRYDVSIQRLRPKTRAECISAPTPCPWMTCRAHLAFTIDEETGSLKECHPGFDIVNNPAEGLMAMQAALGSCCSYDICDATGDGVEGYAGLMALYQAAKSGTTFTHAPGLELQAVGKVLNLGIERVRQLAKGALQELRIKLARIDGEPTMLGSNHRRDERGTQNAATGTFSKLVRDRFDEHFGTRDRAANPSLYAWERREGRKGADPKPGGDPDSGASAPAGAPIVSPSPTTMPGEAHLISFPQPSPGAESEETPRLEEVLS